MLEPDHVYALHDLLATLLAQADAGKPDAAATKAVLLELRAKAELFKERHGAYPLRLDEAYLQSLEQAVKVRNL